MLSIQNLPPVDSAKPDQGRSLIESVLKSFVLENEAGSFRWSDDVSRNDRQHSTKYCYRLTFIRPHSLFGFDFQLTSVVSLNIYRSNDAKFLLRWSVRSLLDASICNAIVHETHSAIEEAFIDARQQRQWRNIPFANQPQAKIVHTSFGFNPVGCGY